jgi:hypothetical protein
LSKNKKIKNTIYNKIKDIMSKQIIATLKVSEVKTLLENTKKKIKINEDFDFEPEQKQIQSKIEPTINKEIGNGRELLLDEDVDFQEIKLTAKDILGKALGLRVSLIKSNAEEGLVKIIKNIEKSAEDLANYQYKNSSPDEKEVSVKEQFENNIYESTDKTKKSKACSQVLQLMDSEEDYSYQKALKKVLDSNPNIKKADLEKELNKYI